MSHVQSQRITLQTWATRLDEPAATGLAGRRTVHVRADADIYLGPQWVDAGWGYKLPAGQEFTAELSGPGGLYAAAAAADVVCYVLALSVPPSWAR